MDEFEGVEGWLLLVLVQTSTIDITFNDRK